MEGLVFLGVMALLVAIGLYFTQRATKYEAGISLECETCHLSFRKTYLRSYDRDEDVGFLEEIHAGHKFLNVEMWEHYRA